MQNTMAVFLNSRIIKPRTDLFCILTKRSWQLANKFTCLRNPSVIIGKIIFGRALRISGKELLGFYRSS